MLEFKLGVLDGSPCEIQAFILHKSIETNPVSPTREEVLVDFCNAKISNAMFGFDSLYTCHCLKFHICQS